MIHFKSRSDAVRARLPILQERAILGSIDRFEEEFLKTGAVWDPDAEGFFTLLDVAEADAPLTDMGWSRRLRDLLLEAVIYHSEECLWEAIYCPNDGWGWTAFIPDSPALPHEVREWLIGEACEADAALARSIPP